MNLFCVCVCVCVILFIHNLIIYRIKNIIRKIFVEFYTRTTQIQGIPVFSLLIISAFISFVTGSRHVNKFR